MRIQNLADHLARAAQSAMERARAKRPSDNSIPPTSEPRQRSSGVESQEAVGSEGLGPQTCDVAPDRKRRIDAWRRRVLMKKGARLHAASMSRGDHCSIAMLDSEGVVVAWYDDSKDCARVGMHVVNRHVSQFYVPADLASNLPGLNLLSAAVCGGNTQQGWRRQPSGAVIWGTTVIEAVVLNDGRLQGFTHVIRPAEGPRADLQVKMPLPLFRTSANARWGMERREMDSSYAGAAA